MDHLLNHYTPSPPFLDQHSLSPPILRYHNLRYLILLTMLLGWIHLLKLAFLVLAWWRLQWSVTHNFILWRIGWTSIKLGSLLSLTITNSELIALRIVWWITWGHYGLLEFRVSTSTFSTLIRWAPPLFFCYVAKGGDILWTRRLDIGESYMHIIFIGSYIAYV